MKCKCGNKHAVVPDNSGMFIKDKRQTHVQIINREARAYGSFKIQEDNFTGEQFINCYMNEGCG